jgi:hypothetical protein
MAICGAVVLLSFIKIKLNDNKYFFLGTIFLTSIFACTQNRPGYLAKNFKAEEGVLYIAFSLECNSCNDEVKIIYNSHNIDFKKVELITMDSEKDIQQYKKLEKIGERLKFNVVTEAEFLSIYGTLSFPQVIKFLNGKVVNLGNEFLNIEKIETYAGQP